MTIHLLKQTLSKSDKLYLSAKSSLAQGLLPQSSWMVRRTKTIRSGWMITIISNMWPC
uniref:Uncharacterized protein n=1 Tax=Anguilla anguilla TaxID=7936 RepID=A0A0E9PJW0_ANGAN